MEWVIALWLILVNRLKAFRCRIIPATCIVATSANRSASITTSRLCFTATQVRQQVFVPVYFRSRSSRTSRRIVSKKTTWRGLPVKLVFEGFSRFWLSDRKKATCGQVNTCSCLQGGKQVVSMSVVLIEQFWREILSQETPGTCCIPGWHSKWPPQAPTSKTHSCKSHTNFALAT